LHITTHENCSRNDADVRGSEDLVRIIVVRLRGGHGFEVRNGKVLE
jgi:hypothetical protein